MTTKKIEKSSIIKKLLVIPAAYDKNNPLYIGYVNRTR